jgi:hypothetical protein
MQTISEELNDALENDVQTVIPKVIVEWANTKHCDNAKIFSSNDYYSRITNLIYKPELYYQFRETINSLSWNAVIGDASGNNHHGKLTFLSGADVASDTSLINGPDYLNNGSLRFPSTNGDTPKVYIDCPKFELGSNYQIEGWISSSNLDGTEQIIAACSQNGLTIEFLIYINIDDELEVRVDSDGDNFIVTGPELVENDTYHFVMSLCNKELKLWVNGVLFGTEAVSNVPLSVSTNRLTIGTAEPLGTDYFRGTIDEFAIYKYELFKDTESVQARYASGIIDNDVESANYIHNSYNLLSDRKEVSFPWAILGGVDEEENIITANGEYFISDSNVKISEHDNHEIELVDRLYNYGWVTRQNSDVSGDFSITEKVVMSFDDRPATHLGVYTSPYGNQINEFNLSYKDEDDVWHTIDILDAIPSGEYFVEYDLGDTIIIRGIALNIFSTKANSTWAYLQGIDISYREDISDDVISVNFDKVKENFDSSVPLGSTGANTCDIALQNVDRKYTTFNKDSEVYKYLRADTKLNVSLGFMLEDLSFEYVDQGIFYADDWQTSSGQMQSTIKCRDATKFMQDESLKNKNFYVKESHAPRAVSDVARMSGTPNNKISIIDTFENNVKYKKPIGSWRLNEESYKTYNPGYATTAIVSNFIGMSTTEFTIDFWAKSLNAGVQHILHYWGGASTDLKVIFDGSDLKLTVKNNTATVSTVNPTDNTWHHWRISWNNSGGSYSVLKDNKSVGTGTLSSGQTLSASGGLSIGCKQSSEGVAAQEDESFSGGLSEFRIWGVSDPTAYPSVNLYGTDDDLIALWPLNEGIGKTANNLCTAYNNLKITNPRWSSEYVLSSTDRGGINNVTWIKPPDKWEQGPILSEKYNKNSLVSYFNGVDTGAKIVDNDTLSLLTVMTIELWCNPKDFATLRTLLEYNNLDSSVNGGYKLYLDDLGYLVLSKIGTSNVTSTIPLKAGKENHVVVTYDTSATPRIKFYIDGELAGTDTGFSGGFSSVAGYLLVGRPRALTSVTWEDIDETLTWEDINVNNEWGDIALTGAWRGTLSNIAIYNKVLTEEEIIDNYYSGKNPSRSFEQFWSNDTDLWNTGLEIATADIGMFYFKEDGTFKYENLEHFYSDVLPQHKTQQYIFSAQRSSEVRTYNQDVQLDGPHYFYDLEETTGSVLDSSGFARNATVTGSVTRNATGLIVEDPGNAFRFTQSDNQYVESVGTVSSIDLFTLEAVVKIEDATNQGLICGFQDGTDQLMLAVGPQGINDAICFYLSWVTNDSVYEIVGVDAGEILMNRIYHVAAAYDGEKATIWVDGEVYASLETSRDLTLSGAVKFLVGGNSAGIVPFEGTIDKAAFYKKAVDEDRIKSHYRKSIARVRGLDNIEDVGETIELQANKVIVKINPANDPNSTAVKGIWSPPESETLYDVFLAAPLSMFENKTLSVKYTGTPFAQPGWLKINDEIIKYETFDANGIFSNLTRAEFGTFPQNHNLNDNVFEVRKYDIEFSNAPIIFVKDPFITAVSFDKRAEIISWQHNSFGAELIIASTATDKSITVLNGKNPLTGVDNFISIAGIPAEAESKSSIESEETSELSELIRKSRLKEITIDNKYITNKELAKNIADLVVERYKDPVPIITLTTLGIPHIQLGDRITLTSLDQFNINDVDYPIGVDYFIMSINGQYDGGYKQTITARKV